MDRLHEVDWTSLRIVLAASRSRSVAATAALLRLNESTVSRHISYVERHLNTVLFHRTPSGITLSESGRELVAYLEQAERQISRGIEDTMGTNSKVQGTVRLTSVPLVINHVLIPSVGEVVKLHPDLTIELVATPSDLSLNKKETDIALRLARPSHEMNVITQRTGFLRYGVYAKANAKKEKMKPLPWISYISEMSHLPQYEWLHRHESDSDAPAVLVNDAETVLAAVRNGLGKSLLPIVIGDADKGLVRVDKYTDLPVRELWLMYHPDIKGFRRFAVILDWIKKITKPLK